MKAKDFSPLTAIRNPSNGVKHQGAMITKDVKAKQTTFRRPTP